MFYLKGRYYTILVAIKYVYCARSIYLFCSLLPLSALCWAKLISLECNYKSQQDNLGNRQLIATECLS